MTMAYATRLMIKLSMCTSQLTEMLTLFYEYGIVNFPRMIEHCSIKGSGGRRAFPPATGWLKLHSDLGAPSLGLGLLTESNHHWEAIWLPGVAGAQGPTTP